MYQTLIPLLVVLPLTCAPLSMLLPSANVRWLMALTAVSFSTFASLTLLVVCQQQGVLSYPMGNWPPPIGIEYRVDLLSCYFLSFISLAGLVTLLAGRRLIEDEIAPERHRMFLASFLLLFTGLCGIVITGDIFNIFVFLEISSLATYTLIALGRNRRSLVAALRYLLIGTVGATFFLIGIGLFYSLTGTLNLQDIGQRLSGMEVGRVYQTAIACVVLGTAIKAAIVPFHLWLPACYRFAPIIVTVFLAAAATKTGLYILYRVGQSVSGWQVFNHQLHISAVLLYTCYFAAVFCPWQAWRQTDFRLLLAWSSLGQIAYMVLGLGLASELGRQASLIQMFNHAFIKSTLFLSLAWLCFGNGRTSLTALTGVGHRRVFPAVIFSFAALGLAGIPLTSGFISKWYLYSAAISAEAWLALPVLVAGSVFGLMYVGKMLATVWAPLPAAGALPATGDGSIERHWQLKLILLLLAISIAWLGIDPSALLELSQRVSQLS